MNTGAWRSILHLDILPYGASLIMSNSTVMSKVQHNESDPLSERCYHANIHLDAFSMVTHIVSYNGCAACALGQDCMIKLPSPSCDWHTWHIDWSAVDGRQQTACTIPGIIIIRFITSILNYGHYHNIVVDFLEVEGVPLSYD